MEQSFITYKDDLPGFDSKIQNELLSICLESWKIKKFNTKVYSRKDAEQHPLYKDLLHASKKHVKITETTREHRIIKTQYHSEASIIRWLAFANSKRKNFFAGDYDIMNINVSPNELVYKNLTFLGGVCPYFFYVHSFEWCEYIIDIFIKNINIMENWNENHVFYHDFDLVKNIYQQKPNIFSDKNIFFSSPGQTGIYSASKGLLKPKNKFRFAHISHYSNQNIELNRVSAAKKILSNII